MVDADSALEELKRERDRLLIELNDMRDERDEARIELYDVKLERDCATEDLEEAIDERDTALSQLSDIGPVIAIALAYDRQATEYHLRKIGMLDSTPEIGFAHRLVWRFSV
jgi:beta-phosphoglucomutase-like phosphatase (HAD superfamily)